MKKITVKLVSCIIQNCYTSKCTNLMIYMGFTMTKILHNKILLVPKDKRLHLESIFILFSLVRKKFGNFQ
ncbi:unnamed protein product [Phytomonas sp. Hart1]|nr:unnamed protein product [Phytomonas sp. Hart1]|eukprot:CCW69303.1 unnamed protein product [Phytomonas sp. isolate Hart1]